AAYGETLQKVLARIESQTAFRALASDVEGFGQIVSEVTGASGTLAESLDPVKMGTAEVMNQFKTLGVTVGEVLLPTIDRLGRRLADVQKWMAENADTVQGLAGFVFKVGIPALGGLGVALKGVSIAARIATAGMRAFWVSTGVGAGIAALSLVIANWGKIRDGIRRAQAAVNDFFGNTRQAERFELLDELMEDVDDLESKLEGLNDTDLTLLLSSFDAVRELADAAGVSVDKMQGKLIEALDKAAELDLKEASLEWSRLHSVLSDYEETRGDFISWGGQFGGGIRLTDEAQADKEAIEAEGGYAVVQERMSALMERIRVLKGGKPVDEDFEDTTESLSAVAEAEKRVTTEAETLTGRMAELAEAFAQTGSVQQRGHMELPGFDDPYRISQKLGIDSDADWERFVRDFGGDTKTDQFGRLVDRIPTASVEGLELRDMSDVQVRNMEATEGITDSMHKAQAAILSFSTHLGNVFDALGMGEVGKGLQAGIGALETVRGGIHAGKQVKSALFGSGDKAGLLGSLGSGAAAGPLLPLVGIAGGIFAFMKIRAARRAKREKRRHQEQMRLQYETIRALNPYNRFKGVSIGSIGRYWSDRVTDDLRVGGGTGGSGKVDRSRDGDDDIGRKQDAPVIKLPDFGISDGQIDTGKPGMVDQMSDLGGRMDTGGVERSGIPERIDTGTATHITKNARISISAPITVNASEGMSARDVANQVSRQLQNTFRQAAHDIG
ncbi:MAG: hypothetical protein OXI23_07400, partial [Gemmatimonadota bacterium]|nr:hypothetical protein [Gemmatimonadota bacterium]